MKEWNIILTYRETIRVPDDWTYDEVMEWARIMLLARGYSDVEISEVERSIGNDS